MLFFFYLIASDKNYAELWNIFKMIFTLPRGQSSTEHGFSVNKQFVIEKLKSESLVALHTIQEHMSSTQQTPSNLEITRELLKHTKQASQQYRESLENHRKEKEHNAKSLKCKIREDETKSVGLKRQMLVSEIETLSSEADKIALMAEKESNFSYLSESNNKKICKEKQAEISELEKMENDLNPRRDLIEIDISS